MYIHMYIYNLCIQEIECRNIFIYSRSMIK